MAVLNWISLQMQDRMTLSEDFMRERIDLKLIKINEVLRLYMRLIFKS
jgi:hypothetical protein